MDGYMHTFIKIPYFFLLVLWKEKPSKLISFECAALIS